MMFTKSLPANRVAGTKKNSNKNNNSDTVVSFKSVDSTSNSNRRLEVNTAIHSNHNSNYMNTPTTCLEDDPNDLLLDSCEGHDVAER